MATRLDHISIAGFKSIQSLKEFPLRSLNVLIGSNGAGKSNFVDFFRMLRAMSNEDLANFIRDSGGADGYFFNGLKQTPELAAHMRFDELEYQFTLGATVDGDITIKNESTSRGGRSSGWIMYGEVRSWMVYHFYDASSSAPLRREQPARDSRELQSDAGNIAAFLHRLRCGNDAESVGESAYRRIREVVQLVAPFFDDFLLEPETKGENEVVRLEWRQKGSSFPFQAWQLSDGTIRFICLATALLQPDPPSTIVIDEPELGLHPFALDLLASLMKETATQTQLIVTTQSPTFLNAFQPEDVIVVDRHEGASRFRRLEAAPLADWLKECTLGDLMQKNVIEGRPSHA